MKQKQNVIAVEVEKDEDGWWAYYADGWKSSTDAVGAQHTDHADTKREIMKLVRSAIPCNCKQCEAKNAKVNLAD